ncbi:MAG: hypothetical protein U5K31_02760 [Balneolaceae bacterium]|nr:hypothetical protein [Balneolaceae bacterium]
MDMAEIKRKYPAFPDLSFSEFLPFFIEGVEYKKQSGYEVEYGIDTDKFIQMYYKNSSELLRKRQPDLTKSDIIFLEMENLNNELFEALKKWGILKTN